LEVREGCRLKGTDLVSQPLRGDDGNLIADALVGLEVERELGVVSLNDDFGGLFDRLSPIHHVSYYSRWLELDGKSELLSVGD
jgi:hypothetical protein